VSGILFRTKHTTKLLDFVLQIKKLFTSLVADAGLRSLFEQNIYTLIVRQKIIYRSPPFPTALCEAKASRGAVGSEITVMLSEKKRSRE
jgi:hypothetical protein